MGAQCTVTGALIRRTGDTLRIGGVGEQSRGCCGELRPGGGSTGEVLRNGGARGEERGGPSIPRLYEGFSFGVLASFCPAAPLAWRFSAPSKKDRRCFTLTSVRMSMDLLGDGASWTGIVFTMSTREASSPIRA